MRIGVDAHHVNGKPQGSRTYLLELLRALSRICKDEILVYSYRPQDTRRVLPEPGLDHRRIFPESARVRIPIIVPALELRDRLDVFHSQYIAPPFSFVSEVVTIHDVLFETHPELFRTAFSRRSVHLIRRSAKRARVVLTVSEFSRNEILERYGLPEEKVVVTPDAVDREKFHPMEEPPPEIRARYSLDRPFLLCVGRLEPRKNLSRLLGAFAAVRERLGSELSLVLAGARDFQAAPIFEQASRFPEGAVHFLGPVPDEDLPAIYNLAEALVYPSLAEGFGMPVLEAMACGTPVLSSPRGALPEVGGDAVLWTDPEDEEALAGAMERILADTALRKRLQVAGPERARRFDWSDTAKKTLEAYRAAAGEGFDRPQARC